MGLAVLGNGGTQGPTAPQSLRPNKIAQHLPVRPQSKRGFPSHDAPLHSRFLLIYGTPRKRSTSYGYWTLHCYASDFIYHPLLRILEGMWQLRPNFQVNSLCPGRRLWEYQQRTRRRLLGLHAIYNWNKKSQACWLSWGKQFRLTKSDP